MEPIFDRFGRTVAWLDGVTVRDLQGRPGAFLRGDAVFSYGAQYLGRLQTGYFRESLFRLALAKSRLRTLVIANPSSEDRQRIRRIFARPLATNGTVVRQYESLQAMVTAWPACLN